ncbi:hypothetical protein DFH28DRAFT_1136302 [Melampsora americana]|nr:hypothetical protein DFH28DRAFT_1136302 [Melampsora americana]
MDEYVEEKDTYRTCKNHHSCLPTGVPAKACYFSPKAHGGKEGLTPVPDDIIQEMLDKFYPDRHDLFVVSPEPFNTLLNNLISDLGWSTDDLDLNNVWILFEQMHEVLSQMDLDLDWFESAEKYDDDVSDDEIQDGNDQLDEFENTMLYERLWERFGWDDSDDNEDDQEEENLEGSGNDDRQM